MPGWLRTIGVGSWLVLGIALLATLLLAVLTLVAEVAIPLAIAAVLAAILVPLTDRLERWRVPRWLGATFVLVLALSILAVTITLIVRGVMQEGDEIWSQIEGALRQANAE